MSKTANTTAPSRYSSISLIYHEGWKKVKTSDIESAERVSLALDVGRPLRRPFDLGLGQLHLVAVELSHRLGMSPERDLVALFHPK